MAQLDNDQCQQARARRPKTSSAGRTLDERRRDHLVLSTCGCCSSSSSSSSSCSSSCCSSASSSASLAGPDGDESRSKRSKSKRGQYLGRRGYELQGRRSSAADSHSTTMQSEQLPSNSRTRAEPAFNSLNQAVDTTCRPHRSQLDRQLSDSSGIGAQLMNVLKINDDLSSSSSSARFQTTSTDNKMLLGHPQQQQQQQQQFRQQQHELDTRSLTLATNTTATTMNSAASVASPAPSTYGQHQEQAPLVARGAPQVPLVLMASISPLQPSPPVPQYHYPQQSLYLSNQEATGIYGQHELAMPQSPFSAMYPVMEPIGVMHPHPHPHPFHHHHHQNRHDESLAYPVNHLVLADCQQQQQQQLDYADLDEETARHQNKRRHQRQEKDASSLPESIIEANGEQLVPSQTQPRSRHSSYYYQSEPVAPQQQRAYSGRVSEEHEPATLTALNSSLDHSHRQHQQLGASTDSRCRLSRGGADLSSSSVGLVDVGQQSSQSPVEMEDELKVCEWRDCGNTFMDMGEFVRHLEEKHVNLEPPERNRFFCLWENCKRNEQEFNARYKLLIHMRVHSGEKPYLCNSESCKKSFSRLENLKIHMRSHTGEKPYKCQFENCAKSFTNSSDRIKHHKTHKDPKPYNCHLDGCTKRYTDPSSLRKHLRAHKRHSSGCSMDSSGEPSNIADMLSNPRQLQQQHQLHQHPAASCHFPAAPSDQSLTQSASSYRLAPDRNPPHQGQHYHQQNSYDQCTAGSSQPQTIEIVQDYNQQELAGCLNSDYDPTREFASVLYSPTESASEIGSTREQSNLTACVADETSYYEHSTYERPYNRQQTTTVPSGHEPSPTSDSYYQPKSASNQDTGRYVAPPPQARTSAPLRQGPQFAARLHSQADLHEHDQHLSKSWGGGGSMRDIYSQQSCWTQQTARAPTQRLGMEAARDSGDLQPHRSRRRVEFDCVAQSEANTSQSWPQSEQIRANAQQQQNERYERPPDQQHLWQPATSLNTDIRNIHHQGQNQSQHQQQLTRSQQHGRLMRSMPADVNFFHS